MPSSRLPRAPTWLLFAGGLGVWAASLGDASVVQSQRFTRTERATLNEHEPVRRPRTQNRDGHAYVGGTAYRVIPRPLAEVWRAVEDSPRMCQMLPECTRQRVVSRQSDRVVMRFTHEYGPVVASYHVRIELDADAHDLSFRLDRSRPNDVREAWGFLQLAPYRGREDQTLVTWGVMADPGSALMTSLIGGMVQASLLRVPDEMYDYLQGPARDRYR